MVCSGTLGHPPETKTENSPSQVKALADVKIVQDELVLEILRIAVPAALALTADPIASLIDMAFIGHLGAVEVAAVGVAVAVFNQVSRVAIFPLVSITTSFVAEDTVGRMNTEENQDDNLALLILPTGHFLYVLCDQVAQVLLTLPFSFSQLGMLSGVLFQLFYGLVES